MQKLASLATVLIVLTAVCSQHAAQAHPYLVRRPIRRYIFDFGGGASLGRRAAAAGGGRGRNDRQARSSFGGLGGLGGLGLEDFGDDFANLMGQQDELRERYGSSSGSSEDGAEEVDIGTDISAAFGGGSGSSGFRGGAKEKLSPAMLLNLFLKMKPVEQAPQPQPLNHLGGFAGGGSGPGSNNDRNIVCKVAPYRICYRMRGDGMLVPLRRAQPINILRVYRKRK